MRQNRSREGATAAVRYRIVPTRPEAHVFEVTCTVEHPDPTGQRFALPAWIPGSYMIREYARHIMSIAAQSDGEPVGITKIDKHTWRADRADGALTVTYEVYAWDLSVRGAHLDTTHGFFNGACTFLRVLGEEHSDCEVEIVAPRGLRYKTWRVATAMREKDAMRHGFGTYQAANYDELIDHPVEMGNWQLATFRACGVPHEIVVTGRHRGDLARLARDLKPVCEQHIRLFGEPAPMDRYVFLVMAVGEGYGGLEHRASTALLCSRDDLPQRGTKKITDRYRTFLGLCSHEYFHTWNVKRIKPAAFTPYDLDRENYTRLLWAFEGITSYYDDLALVRAGLFTRKDYYATVSRGVTDLLRNPGRARQTVAESSFDAWVKYYRQDENSPNAIVSYYGKGSLVALCLDLHIRERTAGRKSLDDVMRALWREHGQTGIGVDEEGVEMIAEEVTGLKLKPLFDAWLRSTAQLPLTRLLSSHGITLGTRPAESASDRGGKPATPDAPARMSLGVRSRAEGKDALLTHVLDGGAAQRAGLSAGDVIVAIDGIRLRNGALDEAIAQRLAGEELAVHAFRRDELQEFRVTLERAASDTAWLEESKDADATAKKRLDKWLGPSK
jgi:predicted metalloprotease with PDZ domain